VLSQQLREETEESQEEFGQDNWSSGRDSNPGSSKYKAEVLTTRPRRSVYSVRKKGTRPVLINSPIYCRFVNLKVFDIHWIERRRVLKKLAVLRN
jgi:hypothetical protein